MRFGYRIGADAICLFHLALVLVAIFGFLFPSIWHLYMGVLVATLISDIMYGYCILSKWEFDLRRKLNPAEDYDFAFATYYTYKITNHRIDNTLYKNLAITYLVLAIGINLYFKYVY